MPDRGNKPDFLFEAPSLGDPGALQVFSFEGEEAVSQLFRFEIKLISKDGAVPFADLVNKPAALVMKRAVGEPVRVQGLVAEFWQGGMLDDDYHTYHAALVPRVWVLGLTHQSRVFQNMTVPEIVSKVLKDAGFTTSDYRLALKATYERREYCVQYRETDLDFVRRLMEHEGIFFSFEEGQYGEVLVLADDRSAAPPIAGNDVVTYNTAGGMAARDIETVRDLVYREHVVTGRVALSDYNYRTPSTALLAETESNGDMPGLYYDYGAHYKTPAEGLRLAKVRGEEFECARRVMTGVSDCMRLHAGATFSLNKPFRSDLALDYFLVQIRHRGAQGASITNVAGGSEAEVHYANEFRCLPAAVPFRPARATPIPRVAGLMTAKIETAGGEYAYLDDQGRYRVHMPFDLKPVGGEGQRSRAIRMVQPYAGAGYGIHFPQHAGAEMIWGCIDGDIDRPIAIGTVPNPTQSSPTTSANKTQNVIRSWGKNELTLDDKKGSENIYLHATKDLTIDAVHDKKQTIGHDETSAVGNNRSRSVGKDEAVEIGENRDKTVGKNESETIGVDKTTEIGSNLSESVGGNHGTSVGKDRSSSVGKNHSETVGENATSQVGKNAVLKVGGDSTTTVAKKTVLQSGDDLTISGGKKAVIDVKDQLTIKCGSASIILKKNGDIQISGNKINVKGSGDVKIKGSKIAEN